MASLQQQFGPIDIYLFDQLLRGNIAPGMSILDAGCGYGRNLVYFLREGYDVSAVDANPEAIAELRQMAKALAPKLSANNFRVESIERMSFAEASFDVVLLNAVLHFAHDDAHFEAMLLAAWQTLKPGGLLFCRLASTIGMEDQHRRIGEHRYLSPDGAERFAVDAALLTKLTENLGAEWVDPLKTTVVQHQRCMTTWVIRKLAQTSTASSR